MSLLKLDLRNKDVSEKLDLGTAHATAMTGNANYPAAKRVPTDAEVAAAQTALQAANDAVNVAEAAWKERIRLRNDAEDAWDVVFTARANNCEAVTPGNAAALAGAGLPLRGEPVSTGPLGAPQNLRATTGDLDGEMDLVWDRLRGSASNVVEYRQQGSPTWLPAGITKKSSHTVKDLTPGTVYEFRVRGVGTDGEGPWSDLAVKRAA